MRLENALDDLFQNRSHVRVLRALNELPQGLPASAREVARRAGVSHPTASKALTSLSVQGIVLRTRLLRADAFELSRRHTAAQQLVTLFAWERGLRRELISLLRRELSRHKDYVNEAFLFGSAIIGDMGPGSDIDVAVVCRPGASDEVTEMTDRLAAAVRERFGNRMSVLIGTAEVGELRKPGRKGYRLWRKLTTDGIPIIGPGQGRGSAQA